MIPPSRVALRWAGADEVEVALAPARAYARLAAQPRPMSAWRALERPALVLLVFGVSAAIMATGRITASLLASAMLVWSVAVGVQLAAAAALIASSRSRPPFPAAVDLFFAGHLPWTIWAMAVAAWHAADGPFGFELLVCGAIAAIWRTAQIVHAFARVVLEATPAGARIRTAAHQAAIGLVILSFAAATSGGWWRLLDP